MSSRRTKDIEALSEELGSLQITEEVSSEWMDTEMSLAPTPAAVGISKNIQAGIPKNMVLDPEWFDSEQMKFENWWRGIRLFLKSNRVIETNNRIMAILAHLRGDVCQVHKWWTWILYFIFYFYFYFVLFSYFPIFRTARVRVRSDQSHCHLSHNLMVWSQHWSQDLGE